MNITSEMVRKVMAEQDCSVTQAVRYLRQAREEEHRMRLEREVQDAKSVDDLKETIVYLLRNLPFRREV